MTDAGYFASPALSSRRITLLLECPALYKADVEGLADEKKSEALRFGSVVHDFTLRPAWAAEKYQYTDLNLATRAGKEWKSRLRDDAEIIKADEYEQALGMADAVREHPQAKMLFRNFEAEQPVFWEQNGIPCKAKPDMVSEIFGNHFIADLKTTESVNPEAIQRTIAKYGYYRQAAWYLRGMEAIGRPCTAFLFIFVEKKFPYLVTMCRLDEEALAKGREECARAVAVLQECRKTGLYPCYTRDILTIGLPKWAKEKKWDSSI